MDGRSGDRRRGDAASCQGQDRLDLAADHPDRRTALFDRLHVVADTKKGG